MRLSLSIKDKKFRLTLLTARTLIMLMEMTSMGNMLKKKQNRFLIVNINAPLTAVLYIVVEMDLYLAIKTVHHVNKTLSWDSSMLEPTMEFCVLFGFD